MTYDYNVYYRQDCIVPLLLVIFVGVIMTKNVVSLLKKCTNMNTWMVIKQNTPQTIFIVVFAFLIVVNSIHLLRGGIYLLFEKPSQAVQIVGTVEDTIEIDALTASKYDVDQNHGRGEALVIDGEKYYLTTYGDLKVGDNVVLTVLPRSRFVLQIEIFP